MHIKKKQSNKQKKKQKKEKQEWSSNKMSDLFNHQQRYGVETDLYDF